MSSDFYEKVDAGARGEDFFWSNIGRLTKYRVISRTLKKDGANIAGEDMRLAVMTKDGQIVEGAIEVKSLYDNKGISYGINGIPTIAFELWESNDSRRRDSWNPGWLQKYLDPDRFENTVKPGGLVYIFFSKPHNEDQSPFLSIAFQRFDKLEPKLVDIAKSQLDIDLHNIRPADDMEYWKQKKRRPESRCFVESNMLNICFDDIKEFARVITIDDGPDIPADARHRTQAEKHFDYYRGLSKEHHDTRKEAERLAKVAAAEEQENARFNALSEDEKIEEMQKIMWHINIDLVLKELIRKT